MPQNWHRLTLLTSLKLKIKPAHYLAALCVSVLLTIGCNKQESSGKTQLKPVSSQKTVATQSEFSKELASPKESSKAPKVVVNEERFDFGEMNPYEFAHRIFSFKNVGTAPLTISAGHSTCSCTIAKFPKEPIQPGESAEIRVEWQTKKNNKRFSEKVGFQTNDPDRPELSIWIEGFVKVHFGADPPGFSIPTAHPGVAEKASTLVSSQVWKDFKVVDVESSLEELQWEVAPAPSGALEKYKVKAAYDVIVTLPESMPQGSFKHWVRLKIDPGNGNELTEYELPLEGKVARRVAVYGPHIDNTGLIKFGVVPSEKGAKQRYVVKVRDKDRELNLKKIVTEPDFVDVKLTPWTGVKEGLGLYYMDLSIPKHQRICDFMAARKGSLRIEFDHPRIESLDLSLELAVIDGGTGR